MNYNKDNNNNQEQNQTFLKIPSTLERFINTDTAIVNDASGNKIYSFNGYVELSDDDLICPICGCNKMSVNNTYNVKLKHLSIGGTYSRISISSKQLICPNCGTTKMQNIPFKDDNHLITKAAVNYVKQLLLKSGFNNKQVAYITGINRNIVKEIDKNTLINMYTMDGLGKTLIRPKHQAKFLSIDEFKLHDGYQYGTHIIDLETGEILWIQEGKKKQVVYEFIKHVGSEWMSNVIAIACDMNSDFEEAFKEKCPHIKIVYDYFHIVKNFNEKVINQIRIDEQKRLVEAGDEEAAKKLKRCNYILYSSQKTLEKKDQEREEGKVISKGSSLFNKQEIKRKGNYKARYLELVNGNELFLIIALIKEILFEAYHTNDEEKMGQLIFDIIELCEGNGNKHLKWFSKLLYNHFDGIITHASYQISSGKIEGINNKIKTLRRQAYGYADDEYFFLKLVAMSRA